jgi:hypothetical protein
MPMREELCFKLEIGNANWKLQPDGRRLLDNMTVAHLYDAFAHGRGLRVVSDHYDGLIEAVIQLLKHVKDQS